MTYFGRRHCTPLPEALPHVTVGSWGADYNSTTSEGLTAAVRDLGADGGIVDVVSGPIRMDRPVVVTKPNVVFRLHANAMLELYNDQAVGMFDFQAGADGSGIIGVGMPVLRSARWNNGQVWVRAANVRRPVFEGLEFRMLSKAGNNTPGNQTHQLLIDTCERPRVAQCAFIPDLGILCCEIRGGRYFVHVVENYFGTLDPSGYNPGAPPVQADCYAALLISGTGWNHVVHNDFWALGTPGNPPPFIAMVEPRIVAPPQPEGGHHIIDGNSFELIYCKSIYRSHGDTNTRFTNNVFGYQQGSILVVQDAGVYLTGSSGGTSGLATSAWMGVGNDMHNIAGAGATDGAHLFANFASGLSWMSNAHSVMLDGRAIVFSRGSGAGTVAAASVMGNTFVSNVAGLQPPILLDSRVQNGLAIINNTHANFTALIQDLMAGPDLVSGVKTVAPNYTLI